MVLNEAGRGLIGSSPWVCGAQDAPTLNLDGHAVAANQVLQAYAAAITDKTPTGEKSADRARVRGEV